jgi:hypothetical protein
VIRPLEGLAGGGSDGLGIMANLRGGFVGLSLLHDMCHLGHGNDEDQCGWERWSDLAEAAAEGRASVKMVKYHVPCAWGSAGTGRQA